MNVLKEIREPNPLGKPVGGDTKHFVYDDFDFGRLLGKGRFGTVYMCREKANDVNVAIKIIFKTSLDNKQTMLQLRREIELQYFLQHRNILILYAFFEDADRIFIVLEACKVGSLFKVLRQNTCLSVHRATYVVQRVADALDYCHVRRVIHRDVKPENILLNDKFEPKLADFGWAVHDVSSTRRQTLCGTPDYLSPEMLDSSQNHAHTYKIDNWAVGVLFYECLTSQTPFFNKDQMVTFHNIRTGLIRPNNKIPAEAMEVIKGLLTIDVNKRSELSEIHNNPFVKTQIAKYEARQVVS